MVTGIELGIEGLDDVVVIGRGGFSTVYSAYDREFDRPVAVKVLHNLDEAGMRRFERERRIMGQLSDHPNVITPFRSDYTDDGNPYLVMEFVEGGSLADRIVESGPVPWAEAVDYIIDVAKALEAAHERGILHRDLKPANVLIANSGTARLTDFGISALQGATATQMAFTLAHTPPETFTSGYDQRDERSDLYSLGSTLYTVLRGQTPFAVDGNDDSNHALMRRIETQDPPTIPPEFAPRELALFVADAMAKDPENRPPTARDFRDDLITIRDGGGYVPRVRDANATKIVTPPAYAPLGLKAQTLHDSAPLSPAVAAVGLPWWRQGKVLTSVAAMSMLIVAVFAVSQIDAARTLDEGAAADFEARPEILGSEPSATTALSQSTAAVEADGAEESNEADDVAPLAGASTTTRAQSESGGSATPVVISGSAAARAVAVLSDGRIVRGGGDGSLSLVELGDNSGSGTGSGSDSGDVEIEFDLTDQEEAVYTVLALPDGRIVSGGPDSVARVRDPDNPSSVVTYDGHGGLVSAITDLALLPDGRVVSASWDETVQVWDPDDLDADPIRFQGHAALVEAAIVVPDGRVASAGRDGVVWLWDPDDPTDAVEFGGPTSTVLALAALDDGRIVVGGLDGEVLVWDPDSGKASTPYDGHTDNVSAAVALPDGRVATASWDSTVAVWSPDGDADPSVVYRGHQRQVNDLAVLPDGRIVSAGVDGTIQIWDPDSIS